MKSLCITKDIILVGIVLAYGLCRTVPAFSQTTPAGSAPPNAAPAAPPAGITNGTLPIQSTILAYKVMVADAARIDQSISTHTAGKIVVIGTSADIAAIIQLRIVLGQERILERRLETLTHTLEAISKPTYVHPVIKGSVKLGAGFIASPADVATLIQTLGSITAVNQTLASASGALNDTSLISLIAQGIDSEAILIPSVFPVNLMANTDVDDTYIGEALTRLESARRISITTGNSYLQALQDAQIVSTTVKGGKVYSDNEIDAAGAFAEYANSITAVVNAITVAGTSVDGFETSLFTGQGYTPPSTNPAPVAGTSPPAPTTPPAPPGAVPAPPLPTIASPTPGAPATTTSPTQMQGQQAVTTSGTTLQQIFSADLLLHEINSGPSNLGNLQLLAVHALESGGGQLTKSNLFLGSRIYFGGGGVASFALYDGYGTLVCSGVAYGYKGNIREKRVQAELESPTQAVVNVSTTCE